MLNGLAVNTTTKTQYSENQAQSNMDEACFLIGCVNTARKIQNKNHLLLYEQVIKILTIKHLYMIYTFP